MICTISLNYIFTGNEVCGLPSTITYVAF